MEKQDSVKKLPQVKHLNKIKDVKLPSVKQLHSVSVSSSLKCCKNKIFLPETMFMKNTVTNSHNVLILDGTITLAADLNHVRHLGL